MGQKGYERSRQQWIKDGRLPEVHSIEESCSDTQLRLQMRPIEWCLGRERRNPDGSVAPPSREETVTIVKQVVTIIYSYLIKFSYNFARISNNVTNGSLLMVV